MLRPGHPSGHSETRRRDSRQTGGRHGRRRKPAEAKRRTLEEILLDSDKVTPEQIAKAQKFSQAAGMDLPDALVQTKAASADTVMSAYAESLNLEYIAASKIRPEENVLRRVPVVLARQNSCVPIGIKGDQFLMASPRALEPQVEEELRLRVGMPVRTVICTAAGINDLINKHYTREMAAAEVAAGGPPAIEPLDSEAEEEDEDEESLAAPEAPAAKGKGKPKAKAKPKAKPKAKSEAPDPLTPAGKKRRREYTIMAFNFTGIPAVVLYVLLLGNDWRWLGVFGADPSRDVGRFRVEQAGQEQSARRRVIPAEPIRACESDIVAAQCKKRASFSIVCGAASSRLPKPGSAPALSASCWASGKLETSMTGTRDKSASALSCRINSSPSLPSTSIWRLTSTRSHGRCRR